MLKPIAALEVVGGLLGYAFLNALVSPRFSVFTLLSLSFFSLCFVAGIELWRGTRRGLWLSLAAQLPQILMFSTLTTGYKLQAGLQALLTIHPTGAKVWFGLEAGSLLGPVTVERQMVALNVVPLVFVAILLVKQRKHELRSRRS